eukprot:8307785-Pyramimonas_sp.AAC.1
MEPVCIPPKKESLCTPPKNNRFIFRHKRNPYIICNKNDSDELCRNRNHVIALCAWPFPYENIVLVVACTAFSLP